MKNGKYVVLCIDDDSDLLDSMRMILEGAKYLVETAGSAEEGLRKYKDVKPDVVVVDLMMEEVDAGTTFVRDIKALGPTPPVYMLSSVGDNLNTNVDYSQLGLTGVLQKPVNPKTLVKTLDSRLKG
jgi:two-component system alkaline phosphatase synthesis response regulator PhoP